MTLAGTPTSRDGIRYFAKACPLTKEDIKYLKFVGINSVKATYLEDAPEEVLLHTPDGKNMDLDEIDSLLNNGKYVIYTEDVFFEGRRLLQPGTKVTAEMISFLLNSDCRSIAYYAKGWTVLGYIYPPVEQVNSLELSEGWVSSVRQKLEIDPNDLDAKLLLTGTMLVAHDLATIVKEDFIMISSWVTIIVACVLIFCFRDIKKVLLSMLPIILGLLYLGGIMSLGNIYFNFINVLVVPIIIGLGVDNGIHLVHRFFSSENEVKPVVMETGRAVVITNLTSIVGFGSLWVGSYKGLTSMGMLSVLGLSMSIIASIFVLPSIMKLFFGKNKG
jgi:hypothetical protein